MPNVAVCGVPEEDRAAIPSKLWDLVDEGEILRAVARVCLDGWRWKEGYAVATNRRLIIVHDDSFIKKSQVEHDVPIAAISGLSVTSDRGAFGGPDLRMFVSDKTLLLHFHTRCHPDFVQGFKNLLMHAAATGTDPSTAREMDLNGERMLVEVRGESVSGPAVVYSNGWAGELTDWRPVTRLLPLTSITFDRPGFGGSPRSPKSSNELEAECGRLLAVADACVPGRHLIVVGWSYGGVIAEAAARLHRDRVVGLVLIDSQPLAADEQDKLTDRLYYLANSHRMSASQKDENARIAHHCERARAIVSDTRVDRIPIRALDASEHTDMRRFADNPNATRAAHRSRHKMMGDVPEAIVQAIREVADQCIAPRGARNPAQP